MKVDEVTNAGTWYLVVLTVRIQRQEEQVQIALEKVGQIVHFFAGAGELLKELQPLIKFDERILFSGKNKREGRRKDEISLKKGYQIAFIKIR